MYACWISRARAYCSVKAGEPDIICKSNAVGGGQPKLRQGGVYPRELRSLSEWRKVSPCIGQMLDRKSALLPGLVKQA